MNLDKAEFFKRAKEVRMTASEKAQIKARLLDFVRANPLPIRSPFFSMQDVRRLSYRYRFMPATLIAVLALTGGISVAAEGSLPGDTLYSVKTLNEEIGSVLAVTPEAKADWQVRRTERRLEEATKLAAAGELDTAKKEVVESGIKVQVEKAAEAVADLKTQDKVVEAAAAVSKLETSLKAHKEVLAEVAASTTPETAAVVAVVEAKVEEVIQDRVALENVVAELGSTTAKLAEDKLAEAEQAADEARKAAGKAKAPQDARSQIASAEELIVEGKAKLDTKKYGEAFVRFQDAVRISREAKLLLEKRDEFKIEPVEPKEDPVSTTTPPKVETPPAQVATSTASSTQSAASTTPTSTPKSDLSKLQ